MTQFVKRGAKIAGVVVAAFGVALVAGIAGGVMGALGALEMEYRDAEDFECGDGCARCDVTACEEHPLFGKVAPSPDVKAKYERFREAISRGDSAVPDTEIDPDVMPVGESEPYDWRACLEYEDVDEIPVADVGDASYV